MQALFDIPSEYDTMLKKGIGITGNDKFFFINGRLDRVVAHAQTAPGRILDFGCGIGDSSAALASRFPQATVVATDLSEAALDFARQQYKSLPISFIPLGQLPEIPAFDLIYLNCVLHHVPVPQRQAVVHQLHQLLTPGGTLWVFENNPANPGTQLAMYTNPFDEGVVKVWPSQLKKWLKTSGLHIERTEFIFYFPQWLRWLRPLEKAMIHLPLGGQYGMMARKALHLQA